MVTLLGLNNTVLHGMGHGYRLGYRQQTNIHFTLYNSALHSLNFVHAAVDSVHKHIFYIAMILFLMG